MINQIKEWLPPSMAYGLDLAEFFYVQRVRGFSIPSSPVFDEAGTRYFLEALPRCHFYLEYGGGGSTVVASSLSKPFLSVDSDPYFIKALATRVAPSDHDKLLYADIGVTGLWGAPLRQAQPELRRTAWRQYPLAPWRRLREMSEKPDLILLDGRFRVACALACLRHLDVAADTTILVDDYGDRPEYQAIERFASLQAMHGRMAHFVPRPSDPEEVERELQRFELDWR